MGHKKIHVEIHGEETSHTVEAYLSATPGLVVHEATGDVDYAWSVTHAVSGLRLPWFFEDCETALTFCRLARGVYPWHRHWTVELVERDRVKSELEEKVKQAERLHSLGGDP